MHAAGDGCCSMAKREMLKVDEHMMLDAWASSARNYRQVGNSVISTDDRHSMTGTARWTQHDRQSMVGAVR